MDHAQGKRPAMLASVIREILAPVLRECPPECGIVSITDVRVTPEYSIATVSISALREPDRAMAYIEGRAKDLRSMLGVLHLRKVPELRFVWDERGERGNRIEQLLREEEERHPHDTSR